MQLNSFGRIASAQWQQLPFRFTDLELGEWVIMPNHIHGILVIPGRGEASLVKIPLYRVMLTKKHLPLINFGIPCRFPNSEG